MYCWVRDASSVMTSGVVPEFSATLILFAMVADVVSTMLTVIPGFFCSKSVTSCLATGVSQLGDHQVTVPPGVPVLPAVLLADEPHPASTAVMARAAAAPALARRCLCM